jgi:hypothetical protein
MAASSVHCGPPSASKIDLPWYVPWEAQSPAAVAVADIELLELRVVAPMGGTVASHWGHRLAEQRRGDREYAGRSSSAARLQELSEPDPRHFVEHLEQARAAGATLPGDPMLVAFAIQSVMLAFTCQWIDNGERGDLPTDAGDDEGIHTLTTFIYAAIHGPPVAATSPK